MNRKAIKINYQKVFKIVLNYIINKTQFLYYNIYDSPLKALTPHTINKLNLCSKKYNICQYCYHVFDI